MAENIPFNPNIGNPYYYARPKKSKWWIPVVIILGILLIFFIGIGIFIGSLTTAFSSKPYVLKDNSVLLLNFGPELEDYQTTLSFESFGTTKSSLWDIIEAIKKAKNDNYIKGIYYKSSPASVGFAMNNEIIEALKDFKKSGKFIYSFIEMGSETDYLKALPSDKIFMPSEGLLEINGFGIMNLFYKGLLDNLGIEFYVKGFEDFKTAGESFASKKFSDSSRYQLAVILKQRLDAFVNLVCQYRQLNRSEVISALNRGIYTADSLQKLGFIDEIASETRVRDTIKSKIFKDETDTTKNVFHLVSVSNYLNSKKDAKPEKTNKEKQIAIIFASGAIVNDGADQSFGESYITPKKIIKYLRQARENDKIKAIILRINSPGGSVIASDAIWEEIVKTRQVKPVYASMSNVAASGGYYLAMACDSIICDSTTITGSIGVISIIPNISKMLDKIDVTVDTISTGNSALELNTILPLKESSKNKLNLLMEGVYKRFISKVASARNMSYEQAHSLAKGRVWTGTDAKRIGLVDTLGSLQTAINIAKKRIGLKEDEKPKLRLYPQKEDAITALLKLFGLGEEEPETEAPIANISLLAQLLKTNNSEAMLYYNALPLSTRKEILYILTLLQNAKYEKVQMALPYNFLSE